MKKVVDVVLEKAFDGFCEKITIQNDHVNLFSDLELNREAFNLIVSRIETILNLRLQQDSFSENFTLGEFRTEVERAYTDKYTMV